MIAIICKHNLGEVIGTTRLEAVKVHRKQADQLIIQAECETQNETREMLEAQAKEEKRIASLLKKSRWTLRRTAKSSRIVSNKN